jgi:RTA1 like protein
MSLVVSIGITSPIIYSLPLPLLDSKMPSYICYPPDDPDTLWAYCPSLGAAISFSCFFGLVTIAHIVQAVIHKKPFSWVLIMGSLWELGGYIFRSLGVTAQKNEGWVTAQALLILLAPLWINAYVYMLLGRMVHFFLDERKLCRIRAKNFTRIFVSLDIISFLVQAIGGSLANQQDAPKAEKIGIRIYMGGIGLQELIILIFTYIAIRFQKKLGEQERRNLDAGEGISMAEHRSPHQARRLLCIVYLVLGLISLRIIFRLVEFSQGFDTYLPTHEWVTYVFDALPMLAALLAFNVIHPGRLLRGPNSDFTEERKAAKQEKKEKKEVQRMEKENKKTAEKERKEIKRMERENKKATENDRTEMKKADKDRRKAAKKGKRLGAQTGQVVGHAEP